MPRKNRKRNKRKGSSPTTVRFAPQVTEALTRHATATGMSASWAANVLIMAGSHAAAGNVSGVNAARKLLNATALAHKADQAAKAKRTVLAKGIREAKAVLNGPNTGEQKPAERKPNAT